MRDLNFTFTEEVFIKSTKIWSWKKFRFLPAWRIISVIYVIPKEYFEDMIHLKVFIAQGLNVELIECTEDSKQVIYLEIF